MNRGTDTKSPSLNRTDVIEKRMEMLATLMDSMNEERRVEQAHKIVVKNRDNKQKKGVNKKRMLGMVAGIFFHRVK